MDLLLTVVIVLGGILLFYLIGAPLYMSAEKNNKEKIENIYLDFLNSNKEFIEKFISEESNFRENYDFENSEFITSHRFPSRYIDRQKGKVWRNDNTLCFMTDAEISYLSFTPELTFVPFGVISNKPFNYERFIFFIILANVLKDYGLNKNGKYPLYFTEGKLIDDHLQKKFEEINQKKLVNSFISNLKSFALNIDKIKFFTTEGSIQRFSKVEGGGSSVGGAIIGGLVAGDAGAIIGSRKEITTSIETIDSRKVWLLIEEDSKVKKIEFDYEFYDIFNRLIPEKEYSYVSLNNK